MQTDLERARATLERVSGEHERAREAIAAIERRIAAAETAEPDIDAILAGKKFKPDVAEIAALRSQAEGLRATARAYDSALAEARRRVETIETELAAGQDRADREALAPAVERWYAAVNALLAVHDEIMATVVALGHGVDITTALFPIANAGTAEWATIHVRNTYMSTYNLLAELRAARDSGRLAFYNRKKEAA